MNRIPTPEQQRVIVSEQPKFVVTAAAGAGKTYVLVERYLRHVVQDGLRPDEILTITFTKKAAAEMKSRIVEALRDRGLTDAAQIAETGPIQTIHSFCERLLRENSLEAGLDPRFEILTESQATRLVSECVREAISTELLDAPNAEALMAYLAGRRQYNRGGSPYGALEAAVYEVLHEFRGSGCNRERVLEEHACPATLREVWNDRIYELLDADLKRELDNVEAATLAESVAVASKHLERKVPQWARGKPDPEAEREALEHTCGLVQLACDAWWRLDNRMTELQALDFTGLEARAVRLMNASPATRHRVQAQYAVVMVDEAQDVNPIQHELLSSLGIQREMLVGDAQQSIYGFRQADVENFRKRTRDADTLRLSKNHRSDAGILNFVDMLFKKIWSHDYERMNRSEDPFDLDNVVSIDCSGVEMWEQAARDTHATAAYVRELIDEGEAAKNIAVLVRDSWFAMELQERLKKHEVSSRIVGGAEKFYTRMEVRDLSNALRAAADSFDDFSLLACLRSPVVGVSLDSVVMLARQGNVCEALETFRAPLDEDQPRIDSFLKWFGPLRQIADRMPAWEVLSEVLARSPYLVNIARREEKDQLLANVRKLLSLAIQEPALGPLEYADRIREIQDLRHREGDAPTDDEQDDVVTLMTIHKSKGLEFPVVVVPQTDRSLTSKTKEVLVDPRRPLELVATKFGLIPCTMHRFLDERRKEREREEELRVLYVALTRAKNRLCICTYPKAKPGTITKLISSCLGETPPPGVLVRQSQSESAIPV